MTDITPEQLKELETEEELKDKKQLEHFLRIAITVSGATADEVIDAIQEVHMHLVVKEVHDS